MEDTKNIELRSDKVRSIIGKIPPWLIRRGIFVLLSVIVMLLLGSYFFKYPNTISATIEFTKENGYKIGIVKIPANEVSKITNGQNVKIRFNKIEGLNNRSFTSKIYLSKTYIISNNKSYLIAEVEEVEGLTILTKTRGKVIIETEPKSILQTFITPILQTLQSNSNID